MNTQEATDRVGNWQKCDVSQLVNHFHFYESESSPIQQKRVESLRLEEGGIDYLRTTGNIESITFEMGLSSEGSENGQLTFAPVWSVRSAGVEGFVPFEFTKPEQQLGLNLVPGIFKDMVSRNWMNLDPSLIDDLFLANKPSKSGKTTGLQRLLYYHFSVKNNPVFFHVFRLDEVREKLKGIYLFPGADFNKMNDRSEYTFSPVIQLVTKKLSAHALSEIARLSLRVSTGMGDSDDDDDSILFEYMMPCPSTCNGE